MHAFHQVLVTASQQISSDRLLFFLYIPGIKLKSSGEVANAFLDEPIYYF